MPFTNGEENAPKGQGVSKRPLTLSIEAKVQDQILYFQYKLKNSRDRPIYLFTVLWDWDERGDYQAARSPLYICTTKKGLVHFASQILPIPKNRQIEVRMIPFCTKLGPGEELSKTLGLPLPLQEHNAYFPPNEKSKYQAMVAEGIFFSIQFVDALDGMKETPAPLPDALQIQHPRLLGEVEIFDSEVLSLKVPVMKRLDEFEEF